MFFWEPLAPAAAPGYPAQWTAAEAAVFIKATKTYTDKAGQARKSHRLVRNVRVDGRVRQQTLLNLGTH